MLNFASIEFWTNVFLLIVAALTGIWSNWKKLRHLWRTRFLRKVWGIKDGDSVIVVCSELENPETRQRVEPREFIYNLKYGDVDAYFEIVITLLRLYPAIKLRVMSAGEIEATRLDLARHLIVVGGPDYNTLTNRVLSRNVTQFEYRSPDMATRSTLHCDEIVIYDKLYDREYCYESDDQDFGYFERIVNPHNPDSRIVLIGGCHTIGVTGAVKAFSMAESEDGGIPQGVLRNAKIVAKRVGKAKCFSVLVVAERVGQTISIPVVRNEDITVNSDLNAGTIERGDRYRTAAE